MVICTTAIRGVTTGGRATVGDARMVHARAGKTRGRVTVSAILSAEIGMRSIVRRRGRDAALRMATLAGRTTNRAVVHGYTRPAGVAMAGLAGDKGGMVDGTIAVGGMTARCRATRGDARVIDLCARPTRSRVTRPAILRAEGCMARIVRRRGSKTTLRMAAATRRAPNGTVIHARAGPARITVTGFTGHESRMIDRPRTVVGMATRRCAPAGDQRVIDPCATPAARRVAGLAVLGTNTGVNRIVRRRRAVSAARVTTPAARSPDSAVVHADVTPVGITVAGLASYQRRVISCAATVTGMATRGGAAAGDI